MTDKISADAHSLPSPEDIERTSVPAGVDRRTAPFTDIEFQSGDLLVFGGPSRRIYHGVPKVYEATGPRDIGLPHGRLSITIRETGLPG